MTLRRVLVPLTVLLLAGGLATGAALSENYGGVSSAYHARMVRYVHAWFDRAGVGDRMVCIMDRESGGNPRAYNDDDAPAAIRAGLLQITWPLWAKRGESWPVFYRRMSDPVQNIRLGYIIYRRHGIGPWLAPGGC